jgi:hypothetical protein
MVIKVVDLHFLIIIFVSKIKSNLKFSILMTFLFIWGESETRVDAVLDSMVDGG